MFERFTDDGRKTVVLANQHARALRHSYIGTAHLLLALTDDEAGPFAQALTSLNVSVPELRTHSSASNPSDAEMPTGRDPLHAALQNRLGERLRRVRQTPSIRHRHCRPGHGARPDRRRSRRPHPGAFRADPHTAARSDQPTPAPRPFDVDSLTASTSARRRGHRPHDAASLHPDQSRWFGHSHRRQQKPSTGTPSQRLADLCPLRRSGICVRQGPRSDPKSSLMPSVSNSLVTKTAKPWCACPTNHTPPLSTPP